MSTARPYPPNVLFCLLWSGSAVMDKKISLKLKSISTSSDWRLFKRVTRWRVAQRLGGGRGSLFWLCKLEPVTLKVNTDVGLGLSAAAAGTEDDLWPRDRPCTPPVGEEDGTPRGWSSSSIWCSSWR